LQRELFALAGPPDHRPGYEENLRDAEERVAYARELVADPESGDQGTGFDPAGRRRGLREALEELAYRRELLEGLDKP